MDKEVLKDVMFFTFAIVWSACCAYVIGMTTI